MILTDKFQHPATVINLCINLQGHAMFPFPRFCYYPSCSVNQKQWSLGSIIEQKKFRHSKIYVPLKAFCLSQNSFFALEELQEDECMSL